MIPDIGDEGRFLVLIAIGLLILWITWYGEKLERRPPDGGRPDERGKDC